MLSVGDGQANRNSHEARRNQGQRENHSIGTHAKIWGLELGSEGRMECAPEVSYYRAAGEWGGVRTVHTNCRTQDQYYDDASVGKVVVEL
jgi:hypothetical protein